MLSRRGACFGPLVQHTLSLVLPTLRTRALFTPAMTVSSPSMAAEPDYEWSVVLGLVSSKTRCGGRTLPWRRGSDSMRSKPVHANSQSEQ